MTASAKHRAVELLWIVGAAAVSIIVITAALEISSRILGVEVDGVVEAGAAALAAVGGGVYGSQSFNKRKAGDS